MTTFEWSARYMQAERNLASRFELSDQNSTRLVKDWPGKSYPKEHPALWHMLDIGAVARHMLDLRPICGDATDLTLAFLTPLRDLGPVYAKSCVISKAAARFRKPR